MPEAAAAAETVQERMAALGKVDLVVGIASFNNAGTIGHVVEAARNGLAHHFSAARAVIVNADGGSADGTPEKVRQACGGEGLLQLSYPVYKTEELSAPQLGLAGRSRALHAIFEAVRTLEAKGCAILEPDLRSTAPEWTDALLRPLVDQQCDLVAPEYLRHKFEGLIGKAVIYPLTRALYGKRIRHPMGGDCGYSAKLIAHYLTQDSWTKDAAGGGVEIWLTTRAICGRFGICQARLGPRIREEEPRMDLSELLARLLGPLFQAMERDVVFWQRVRGSEAIPVLGEAALPAAETAAADAHKLIDSFRLGYQNLIGVWGLVLSPATLLELKRVARMDAEQFRLPDETWVRAIYDFALGHRLRVINREHLLRAMTPLYLGWVASFVLEMREADPAEVERRLERLCLTYESNKPYLISRWRWPERFTP